MDDLDNPLNNGNRYDDSVIPKNSKKVYVYHNVEWTLGNNG